MVIKLRVEVTSMFLITEAGWSKGKKRKKREKDKRIGHDCFFQGEGFYTRVVEEEFSNLIE